jgi:hypothetical protein
VAADLCRLLASQMKGRREAAAPLFFPRVVASFLCGGRFLASPEAERPVNRLRTKAQDSHRCNLMNIGRGSSAVFPLPPPPNSVSEASAARQRVSRSTRLFRRQRGARLFCCASSSRRRMIPPKTMPSNAETNIQPATATRSHAPQSGIRRRYTTSRTVQARDHKPSARISRFFRTFRTPSSRRSGASA